MKFFPIYIFFFFGSNALIAQLNLPDFFTDDMVLQRGQPIQFWGKGIPGETLEVQFSKETKKTKVHQDSTWHVVFKRRKANSEPQSIQIKSNYQKIVLKNVLIGDIWLCIGQSNMEWPMEKEMLFAAEAKSVDRPMLRFYNPTYAGKNIYNEHFTDSVLRLLNKNDFYR